MEKISPEKRQKGFNEINSAFSEDIATGEAHRCFSCGICNGCENCFVYCPDFSVLKGDRIEIDYNYCKGCGICENECPVGFIQMEKENVE